MKIVKPKQAIVLMSIIIGLSACSSTKSAKKTIKNKPVKVHRVQTQTPEREVYASLLAEWEQQGLLENTDTIVKTKVPTPVPQWKKTQQRKTVVEVRKYKKPAPKRIHRKPAKRVAKHVKRKSSYRAPSHKAPIKNIRYASLSGDYAYNQQTQSFINMMASKHGFDRGYLNYLFSNTKATSFLKRMAYSDAYGSKKRGIGKARPGRWNRYRGNFLTKRTINKGMQFWRENRVALKRAEQRFGVPEEYILGIIGVETRYGGNVGKNRAIDALSAMGFNNPRRGKYFRSELEAYLLMTRSARLDPLKPMASYAGALGLGQFMPSNIKRFGIDHDGSGAVNLWTPSDAIGSVANYFKKHGWRKGGTVAVPAFSTSKSYRTLKTGYKSSHSISRLKNKGIKTNYLGNLSGKASLIKLNTYSGDELWLGGHNFYVITRYNHSTRYAMAVHQLAQAIKKRIGGKSTIRQASTNTSTLNNPQILALLKK